MLITVNSGGVISLLKNDYKRVGIRYFAYLLYPNQFSYVFWFRIYSSIANSKYPLRLLRPIVKLLHELNSVLVGVQIPLYAKIGGGLCIKHFSGVVVNGYATLGWNITLFQNVTIGRSFAGKNNGVPKIGNNVIIFPGASVIGNIEIGDNVVIGANSVVLTDIPSNSIVAGNPARVVSNKVEAYFSQAYFSNVN